jgi:hypothetical protein
MGGDEVLGAWSFDCSTVGPAATSLLTGVHIHDLL